MKSGYKIRWTDHALFELKDTIEYLEENWTDRELKNFSEELDHTIELISKIIEIQTSRQKKTVRRAVVAKFNNLYY